jgi:hypothetical protein
MLEPQIKDLLLVVLLFESYVCCGCLTRSCIGVVYQVVLCSVSGSLLLIMENDLLFVIVYLDFPGKPLELMGEV